MKKLFWGILFLELVLISPLPSSAEVHVGINIGIPLPPDIVFASPPQLIVLPDSYVYVAPDVDADIFFYNGWWWRPWQGRWYRSHNYNSGWSHYSHVPAFYREIPSNWRNDYREHRWKGHRWNHQRLPYQQVHRNWRAWEKTGYWKKQKNWGVQGVQSRQSRPQSQQVRPQRSRQPREAGPQSRKAFQPQHSQERKGGNKKGHGDKKGR